MVKNKPVLHAPSDPRTFLRTNEHILLQNERRVLDIVIKWPGVTLTECEQHLHVKLASSIMTHLLAENFVDRKKIKIMDAAGNPHWAWALYCRKKK